MTPIELKYESLSGPEGILGNPIGAETGNEDGIGRYRHYKNGSIFWHPSYGAHFIGLLLKAFYAAVGYTERLGYPLEDERNLTTKDIERWGFIDINLEKLIDHGIDVSKSQSEEDILKYGRIILLENGAITFTGLKQDTIIHFNIESKEYDLYNQPKLLLSVDDEIESNSLVGSYDPGFNLVSIAEEVLVADISQMGEIVNSEVNDTSKYVIIENKISELPQYKRTILHPILKLSANSKRSLVYKKNVDEYKNVIERKARLYSELLEYKDDISMIPSVLDLDYITIITWQKRFEEWFINNGFKVPSIEQKVINKKIVWDEGIKAAAVNCIEMHQKKPNVSQIAICEEFLRKWEIFNEPNYSPQKLSNMVSKIKYEGTD